MSEVPRALIALEKDLAGLSDEAMTLSELDGYVAGLLVCPEMIPPSEWLRHVWGTDENGEEVAFESEVQMKRILNGVMAHYNSVARDLLDPEAEYGPIFDVDKRTGDLYWEMWADGFIRAVNLRPDAWSALLQAGDDYTTALVLLMTLGALATTEEKIEDEEALEMMDKAPDVIPEMVGLLNEWRHLNADFSTPPIKAPKVGRNEPCPCGSGKKYKKCCGAN